MSLEARYNLKSPGVKRLMREAIELANPTEEYYASPLEDNLFEWHFTVRGPPSTEFEGGCYHGRILLPSQYPMQPPNIILLTPNGRFEVNKKICLSISGHHPESWQPSWSIRTALLALIAFMPTSAAGTIGSLDYTAEERRHLAAKSRTWECAECGRVSDKLAVETAAVDGGGNKGRELTEEETAMISQIALKAEDESNRKTPPAEDEAESTEKIEEPTELRQRITTLNHDDQEVEITNIPANVTDSLLEASIQRTNKDRLWTAAIWIILTIITLLILRRCFLM